MDKYDKGTILGTGTFGSVFKATNKEVGDGTMHDRIASGVADRHRPQTGQVVAIKKIKVGATSEVSPTSQSGVSDARSLTELNWPLSSLAVVHYILGVP